MGVKEKMAELSDIVKTTQLLFPFMESVNHQMYNTYFISQCKSLQSKYKHQGVDLSLDDCGMIFAEYINHNNIRQRYLHELNTEIIPLHEYLD